ncbi:MAG: hypothetical protein Kow00129_17010 [Thermoleophilia bacterium]
MGNKRLKFLVVGLVVLAAIASLATYAIQQNAVYYYTVGEVVEKGPSTNVRVSGSLVNGTVEQGGLGEPLRFQIRDEGIEEPVLFVTYTGTVPDNFRDDPGVEVVLTGDYLGESEFDATEMLAKCPSKYEAAEEEAKAAGGSEGGAEEGAEEGAAGN